MFTGKILEFAQTLFQSLSGDRVWSLKRKVQEIC